jgi:hypothetical protein
VFNRGGEKLGKVEGFGIDPEQGRIAYVGLSFGGFLGFGDKWFAVPWEALEFLRMTIGSSSTWISSCSRKPQNLIKTTGQAWKTDSLLWKSTNTMG